MKFLHLFRPAVMELGLPHSAFVNNFKSSITYLSELHTGGSGLVAV